MSNLFIVRGQIKLSLWFVGTCLFAGLLGTWDAWRKVGLFGGEERFLLFATVTGGLALAWIALLGVYLAAGRFMQTTGKKNWSSRFPWWALKLVTLLVFIAAIAIGISWLSAGMANEFTMLEKGDFEALGEKILTDPEALERIDKKTGKTLLALALESNRPEAVELLLESGAELAAATNGQSWVVSALLNLPMLETLLHHDVDPDAADADGMAAIHYAVGSQNTEALALLLEHGASADARDPLYQTPLLLAIMADHLSMAVTLLEYGADPNLWDRRGDTALHKAVRRRNLETTRFLIEHGADPKYFNFTDMCPLHIAALNGQDKLVELFLEQSGMIDLRNEDDRTAFDHALRGRKYETVRLLLNHGANIDRIMENGYTAIHLMVMAKDYNSVRFLIEEGADVHIVVDTDGETTYNLMRKKQLQTLIDLVDEHDNPTVPTTTNDVESATAPE